MVDPRKPVSEEYVAEIEAAKVRDQRDQQADATKNQDHAERISVNVLSSCAGKSLNKSGDHKNLHCESGG